MIDVNNLHVWLGNRHVLKGITMHIERGQVTSLVGPNACGKTTLLKTIAGHIRPDMGKIAIDGMDIQSLNLKERASKIRYVDFFQRTTHDEKVLNILLLARLYTKSIFQPFDEQDFKIARESMERMGISDLEERFFNSLSSGEKEKVVFSSAISSQALALLLDEPSSFLDIRSAIKLARTMLELKEEENKTIIFVSHDLNLAINYSDSIVVMKDGQKIYHGETADAKLLPALQDAFEVSFSIIQKENRTVIIPEARC